MSIHPVSLTHYGVLHEGPSKLFKGVYRGQWYPLCQHKAPTWFRVGVLDPEVGVYVTDETKYLSCGLCQALLTSGESTCTTEDQLQQDTMK